MQDHNGLFARWLPIGSSAFATMALLGFCLRRFDLFAIKRLAVQSVWIGCFVGGAMNLPRFNAVQSAKGPVINAILHHRPSNPRRLIGQCHGGDIGMPVTGNASDPLTESIMFVVRCVERSARAVDQQRAQVSITALADAEEPFFCSGACLPWR